MRNLLVGNGINIQFDKHSYTAQQIMLRILKNCDRDDFPTHIIVNESYLLKNNIGEMFLEARNIINGKYDDYINSSDEAQSLDYFKSNYGKRINTLKITDIGFEDYYLISELVCNKTKVTAQLIIGEALRMAYLFSIFNDGKINKLFYLYPEKFITYLNNFNVIFTTNYDSNIEHAIDHNIYHIHGCFETLSAVYDENSFRNKLPDAPINKTTIDSNYYYLYSNTISTHSGKYKELQQKQSSSANYVLGKLASAYLCNTSVKNDVDSWINKNQKPMSNVGYAVVLKSQHPELSFSDDYHFDKFRNINGELEILGLSPWNDYHLFEIINNSNITKCTYYFYTEDQCEMIKKLLPALKEKKILHFCSTKEFWERMNEA